MRASGFVVVAAVALALGGAGWLYWQSTASRDGDGGDESRREAVAARRDGPELAGRRAASAAEAALDEGRFEIHGLVNDAQGRPLADVVVEARFRRPPAPTEPGPTAPVSLFGPMFGLEEPLGEELPLVRVVTGSDGTFALVLRRRGDFALQAQPEPPRVGLEKEVTVEREQGARVVLEVVDGSALHGRVVDAADRGIDAVLWAMWSRDEASWHPAAVATAPGTGAFAFAAVPAGDVYLRILLPGRLLLEVRTTTPRTEELVIRLGAFAPLLAGTVRDVEGRPIAGARVGVALALAAGVLSGANAECFAVSDADGRYRIEGPVAGPVAKVRAEAAGFLPLEQEPPLSRWSGLVLAPGREATLDLTLWRGGTLSGTVRERGTQTPLPGAVVVVAPAAVDGRMGAAEERRAVSDAQGRYTVVGVPVGRSLLVVDHPTHYFAPLEALPRPAVGETELDLDDDAIPDPPPAMTVFLAREGERLTRDFELERGLAVAGQVVDSAGLPVTDAEIRALGRDLQLAWHWGAAAPERPALGRSAADGRFRVTGLAPRPDWTLYAGKAGLVGEPSAPLLLRTDAPAPDVTLRLLPGATVVGRVVDAAGNGCPNASVQAWTFTTIGFYGDNSRDTTAGPDGTFRLEHLTPGTVQISGSSTQTGAGSTTVEDLAVGQVREGVLITLAPSVTVTGLLVDEQGTPVRNKSLTARPSEGGEMHYFDSDRQGRFHFEVNAPGEVLLHAQSERESVLARIDAPAADVRVVWKAPPSLVVEGLVTDAAGQAVPLCRVDVKAEAEGGGLACGGGSSREEGSPVVHGWFRKQMDGAAPIEVKVSDARDAEGRRLNLKNKVITLPEAPTGPVTIALEPGLAVSGRVLDAAGGPVAGVAVRAGEVHATSDDDGAFRLGGLAGEALTLTCHPVPPWIVPPAQTVTASSEEVVFRLRPGLAVAGCVVDAQGHPMNQVTIEAQWPESAGCPAGSAATSVMARDGRFRLRGIPDTAVVSLAAQAWDDEAGTQRVTGIRAGTEDVVIRFGVGATVEGFIVDAAGHACANAHLTVRSREDEEEGVRVTVQPDGTFRATGLATGPVWFTPERRGGGPESPAVRVEAPATNVRIALPPTAPLHGRLVGARGETFRVWAWRVEDTNQTACALEVRVDGQFEIEGAGTAGTWMVGAQAQGGERYGLTGPVPAGSRDVVLELRPGRTIEGVVTMPSGGPPIAKATWILLNAENPIWSAWTRPDERGRFTFRGVPPGSYAISASVSGSESLSAEAAGVADGTRNLKLALERETDGR